jgi:hypothetical protein
MKDTLAMVILMDLEEEFHLKVKFIKEHSAMIKWKDLGFSNGQMVKCMKEIGNKEKRMGKGYFIGLMGKFMKENSKIMSAMD